MRRVLGLLRRPATGALTAQGTQAVAGFALQVAAARELGAAGLVAFSVAYGAIVLATALCSGLVGDSLTVLDRRDSGIRAGLHVSAVLVSGGAAVTGAAVGLLTDAVPPWAGLLLGVATAAFIVEDTLCRLLMATGRFWPLTAVDATGLTLALAVLLASWTSGGPTLTTFVVALLVGQTGAALVAWVLLPAAERPRGPWRQPALRAVASYGAYKAALQAVRPALLTLLRLAVVAVAGAAAYAPLEAARVYTSPALVLVAGMGSFLLPHFVAMRPRGPAAGLRSADRAAVGLTLAVAVIGVLAVLALPWLGPLLTGGAYAVPVTAVAAWTGYAIAGAVLLPYGGMASVHGGHRRLLALRTLEFAAPAVVLPFVLLADGGPAWAPLVLAVGPLVAAWAVRRTVLVPLVRAAAVLPARELATA